MFEEWFLYIDAQTLRLRNNEKWSRLTRREKILIFYLYLLRAPDPCEQPELRGNNNPFNQFLWGKTRERWLIALNNYAAPKDTRESKMRESSQQRIEF